MYVGHKTISKLQISKSTPKGDISKKKNPFSRTTTKARLDYKVVFLYLWHHKYKSHLLKAGGGGLVGENTWLSSACFRIQTQCGCFYITVFWWKQQFSGNVGCHFHFILHVMSDKAAFVSGALFCVQRYQETSSSPAPTAPPAGRELICIYAATNSIGTSIGYTISYKYIVLDYGINKFNCITVSWQL